MTTEHGGTWRSANEWETHWATEHEGHRVFARGQSRWQTILIVTLALAAPMATAVLAEPWFLGVVLRVVVVPWALVAVWDGIASAASWMWSSVLQPVFRFVQSAFSAMVAAIQAVWTGVLRPVFQAVASVVQWLWSSVAQPVFRFISSAWSTMVSAIQAVWTGVLRPVIQLVADIIR